MKKSRVLLAAILVLALSFGLLSACSSKDAPGSAPPSEGASNNPEAGDTEQYSIQMINCAYSIQFCDIEKQGAEAAAAELGNVELIYNAPQQPNIQTQVDQVNSAINQTPDALLVAALDPGAIAQSLQTALDKKIPVVAYDVSLPDAPDGSVVSTISTNNVSAAALAAENMWKAESLKKAVEEATSENPVIISVISPDATTNTHAYRIEGFTDRMFELISEARPGEVAIEGSVTYNKEAEKEASVIINVAIATSSADTDVRNCAQSVVSLDNIKGIFCVNEAAVTALLSVTSDGLDLDRDSGKYKDVIAVGFDAGSTQKTAVKNGWFYGAVAQNPYDLGYQAVMTAVAHIKGETVKDVDAEAKWYCADNMEEGDIAVLLYD